MKRKNVTREHWNDRPMVFGTIIVEEGYFGVKLKLPSKIGSDQFDNSIVEGNRHADGKTYPSISIFMCGCANIQKRIRHLQ